MMLYKEFENHLQDALNHLYDPLYDPPASLWEVMEIGSHRDVGSLQRAVLRSIRSFKPLPATPPHTRLRRLYSVLSYRYVQGLTQEATAEAMGITPRYVRKLQRQAVNALARTLWDRMQTAASPVTDHATGYENRQTRISTLAEKPPDWASQIKEELASLERQSSAPVAQVGPTLYGAVNVARSLTEERNLGLTAKMAERDSAAIVHPSALREVLLSAVSQLAHHMSSGEIQLSSRQEEDFIVITVTGSPVQPGEPYDLNLIREILSRHAGSVELCAEQDIVSLTVRVCAAQTKQKTVIIVEDNSDLVLFYRSCVAGTRYRITHVAEARYATEVIAEQQPDIIVLDVLLPDPEIDGWELLIALRANPETRSIPIIVCSVVQEKDLLLSLGAVLYLPKPVRCQQFLDALDHVLNQDSRGAPPTPVNRAAPC
jgi:CheY-like chemotaxis protein/transcriptional regulator with XRE-family HTH domain